MARDSRAEASVPFGILQAMTIHFVQRLPRHVMVSALCAVTASASCASVDVGRRAAETRAASSARLPIDDPVARARGPIHWAPGLEAAMADASRRDKPMLVYLHTSWCGPCKRLAATTFKDKAFAEHLNRSLIAVSLDAEKEPGRTFCRDKSINSYPTLVFLGSDGREIDRTFGYRPARQMGQLVDNMLADRNTVDDMRRRIATKPDNLGLRMRLGQHLAMRGETTDALKHLNHLVKADERDKHGYASRALFAIGRYVHRSKTRNLKAAAVAYERLLTEFPKSNSARPAAMDLATIRVQKKDRDGALAILKRFVKANPTSAAVMLDAASTLLKLRLAPASAITWAKTATALRKDGFPWFVLGRAYERAGKLDDALIAFRKATQASPGNPRFLRALETVRARLRPQ
ncbi:MAG: tetratricopeptide (TPR) repeat protein [Myxococcota bacterium]